MLFDIHDIAAFVNPFTSDDQFSLPCAGWNPAILIETKFVKLYLKKKELDSG